MKRLRFKRGIRINLAKGEEIKIPSGEYWKVMFGGKITAYAGGGSKAIESGLDNYSNDVDKASSIRTILPAGTILKNTTATDNTTLGSIIGIAFEEVDYV